MIHLYKADNTTIYNPAFGHGDYLLHPTNAEVKIELNGVYHLEMEVTEEEVSLIKVGDVVHVPSPLSMWSSDKQLFRISETEKTMDGARIFANHLFFDLAGYTILDKRPTNKNGDQALKELLKDTPFNGYSNINKVNTAYYVRTSVLAALCGKEENSFMNRWGGELAVTNTGVCILDKVGTDHGVMIAYGKNMTHISEKLETDSIATRLIPTGYDGIMLEGDTPWVDSPLINNYPRRYDKVVKFDDIKVRGTAHTSVDDNAYETLAEAQAEMIRRCNSMFDEGIDKPKAVYKVSMVNLADMDGYEDVKALERVNLGDTVKVRHKALNIDLATRCVALHYDSLEENIISITLGTKETNYFDNITDANIRLDRILTKNGDVDGLSLTGIIDGFKTAIKAQRNIEHPQEVRSILFEDRIEGSPTYGAMSLGTMGFAIADKLTADGDWDWRTFGTGKGFMADLIVAGLLIGDSFELNLDAGTVKIGKRNADGVIDNPQFLYANNQLYLSSDAVQFAFNNVSTAIKFHDGALWVYDENNKPIVAYSRSGINFFSNDTGQLALSGRISLTQLTGTADSTDKGLAFNMNGPAKTMSWNIPGQNPNSYTPVFIYRKAGTLGPDDPGGFEMGHSLTMHGALFMDTGIDMKGNSIINNNGQPGVIGSDMIISETLKTPSGGTTYLEVSTSSQQVGINIDFSDKRLKKNISPSKAYALETINRIQHRRFDWKEDDSHQALGYIAQELKEVSNDFVTVIQQDSANVPEIYQISTAKLLPYITKSIQELSKRIDRLEARLVDDPQVVQAAHMRIQHQKIAENSPGDKNTEDMIFYEKKKYNQPPNTDRVDLEREEVEGDQ